MKETIYTIPLTEAFLEDLECPFCALEKKIEQEQISYALGPAMMEPDHRILSNELGYCAHHIGMMAEKHMALPFALIHESRLDSVLETLDVKGEKGKNKRRFSKKESYAKRILGIVSGLNSTCIICDKLEKTMQKFADTFWYMYKREPEFKAKVLSGNGFCLKHFQLLLEMLEKCGGTKKEVFAEELFVLEHSSLLKQKEELSHFIGQFDYRSDKENNNIKKDAHLSCAKKLSGSFERK